MSKTKKNNQVETNSAPNTIPSKENEWKIVIFTKKNIQPPKQLNFGKGQVTTMEVTLATQPLPGQAPNPTSPVLGRVTSTRSGKLQEPIMEFQNKFQMLSNAGPSDFQSDLFYKGPIAKNIDTEPLLTKQLAKAHSHTPDKLPTL